ncbi:hypothetical protein TNCV_1775871 [Trichonephila clavipes]|nr:hypothetical protein TNCV_1775871 [Trichonephila clavipes]
MFILVSVRRRRCGPLPYAAPDLDGAQGLATQSRNELNEKSHAAIDPGRSKKRKFSGNRFTTQNDTEFTTVSSRKLKTSMNISVLIGPSFEYCILEFVSVFAAVSKTLKYVIKVMTMGCPIDREAYTLQKRDETRFSCSERRTSDTVKQERMGSIHHQKALRSFAYYRVIIQ